MADSQWQVEQLPPEQEPQADRPPPPPPVTAPLLRTAKVDMSFFTLRLRHDGQGGLPVELIEHSSSNTEEHFKHSNSYSGITTNPHVTCAKQNLPL